MHEETSLVAGGRRITTGNQPRALLDALADVALDALLLCLGDQGTHETGAIHGIADDRISHDLNRDTLDFGLLLARHQHPSPGVARLTGVDEDLLDAAPDGAVEVGVVKDHVG